MDSMTGIDFVTNAANSFGGQHCIGSDMPPTQSAVQSFIQRPMWPTRACEECKRKKTKCDMGRPACSLCARVGSECIFPTKRKRPEPRRNSRNTKEKKSNSTDGNTTFDNMLDKPDWPAARRALLSIFRHEDRIMQLISPTEPSSDSDKRCSPASARSEVSKGSPARSRTQDVGHRVEITDAVESNIPQPTKVPHFPHDPSDQQIMQLQTNEERGSPWQFQQLCGPFGENDSDLSQGLLPDEDLQWVFQTPVGHQDPPDVHYSEFVGQAQSEAHYASSGFSLSPSGGLFDASGPKTYSLTVPEDQVVHLVELFFSRVSSFLPIFHRPRFYTTYISQHVSEGGHFRQLDLESALILNGIMSLSARFSTSSYWSATTPNERGEVFAQKAKTIFADATSQEDRTPTLSYLQGCILLAFYHHTNSPSSFGWMLSGVCMRLAYDLGINYVDEDLIERATIDRPQWSSAEDWVEREEKRRAFWSVWELDAFPSTMSRRPYAIDVNKIKALLPASDDHWFAAEPIPSAFVGSTPATAWKSLRGSPNQTERAWFLVANSLMLLASDLVEQKGVSQQTKEEMESVLSCFALSLPEHFRVTSNPPVFNEQTFPSSNWIMATNIMLTVARSYAALITTCHDSILSPTSLNSTNSRQACVQHGHDIVRVVRAWTPDYIAYTTPFIACSLVGPAAMHFLNHESSSQGLQITSVDRELVLLTIHQFARYWKIGSLLIDITTTISKFNTESPCALTAREKELAVRYASIMPSMETRNRANSMASP
ncbi:hypothetical protein LTR67_005325 [Exophiala xenobiotica]